MRLQNNRKYSRRNNFKTRKSLKLRSKTRGGSDFDNIIDFSDNDLQNVLSGLRDEMINTHDDEMTTEVHQNLVNVNHNENFLMFKLYIENYTLKVFASDSVSSRSQGDKQITFFPKDNVQENKEFLNKQNMKFKIHLILKICLADDKNVDFDYTDISKSKVLRFLNLIDEHAVKDFLANYNTKNEKKIFKKHTGAFLFEQLPQRLNYFIKKDKFSINATTSTSTTYSGGR